MKNNMKFLMAAGVVVLTLAFGGCGKNVENEQTSEHGSNQAQTQDDEELVGKTEESKDVGQRDTGVVLDKKGYSGPYVFMYPSADSKNPANFCSYYGTSLGFQYLISVPTYGVSEDKAIDVSTIDMFIEGTEPRIKADLAQISVGKFGHFDGKFFFNVDSKDEIKIKDWEAYEVHGKVGDESYDVEEFFVAYYVMNEEAPFFIFGIPDSKEPGTEEDLTVFLKMVAETFEWNAK